MITNRLKKGSISGYATVGSFVFENCRKINVDKCSVTSDDGRTSNRLTTRFSWYATSGTSWVPFGHLLATASMSRNFHEYARPA